MHGGASYRETMTDMNVTVQNSVEPKSLSTSANGDRNNVVREEPEAAVQSVGTLLACRELEIPDYQRAYKWTEKHVGQLWSDLARHKADSSYRLGTVVLRGNKNRLEIVDGQQRLVTLVLIVEALLRRRGDYNQDAELKSQLESLEMRRFKPEFGKSASRYTRYNVWNNYRAIERRLSQPGAGSALFTFILKRCEFVVVTLTDISEAFQFFDSQNSRGKDLQPHDLLKAYHLRQFETDDKALKIRTVNRWENTAEEEMADLFDTYLYRIRCWYRGVDANPFSKGDIDYFKGIDLSAKRTHPMAMSLQMADRLTDRYNADPISTVDGRELAFPHQLDQTIVNGRRFFEWVSHYQALGFHKRQTTQSSGEDHKGPNALDGVLLGERAYGIMELLNSYPGRYRTGDQYVRSIFDCLIMYYMDRFGYEDLSAAIEKTFIWAYSLRLKQKAVQRASMNRHVLEDQKFFSLLRDAVHPREFLDLALPQIAVNKDELAKGLAQGQGSEGKSIFDLFHEMQYVI